MPNVVRTIIQNMIAGRNAWLKPRSIFLLVALLCPFGGYALSEEQELAFLEQVLFKKRLLSNGTEITRWNRRPTLSLISGSEREAEAFDFAIEELERPLRPVGYRIRPVGRGVETADILIFHLRYSELGNTLKEYGLPMRFARLGVAHAIPGDDGSIDRVFIFLDSRVAVTDEGLRRRALKLLLAAIGLGGETQVPVNSIFLEVPPSGIGGEVPQALSSLDIRAIRLLYAYLSPGDEPDNLLSAYQRFWPRLL